MHRRQIPPKASRRHIGVGAAGNQTHGLSPENP